MYPFEKQRCDLTESGFNRLPVVSDQEINRRMRRPLGVRFTGDKETQAFGLFQIVLHAVVGKTAVKVGFRTRRQVQGHLPQPVNVSPGARCKTILDGAVGLVGHHKNLDPVEILVFGGAVSPVLLFSKESAAGNADVVATAHREAINTVYHALTELFEYMIQLQKHIRYQFAYPVDAPREAAGLDHAGH